MKFTILTLFPDMIMNACKESILGRAISSGLIQLSVIDIRKYARNRYGAVDDYPFGGGAGMVMQASPIDEAISEALGQDPESKDIPVIYMSPAGRVFTQEIARELSSEKEIVLLCGHYEGVDQRIIQERVTDEISIGDFVLTGGELAALVVMDAVSRLVPGVLGNEASSEEESFSGMWLEYPQYTRPREFHGMNVPDVLLSGNHAAIRTWRLKEAIRLTVQKRPDLIREEKMTKEEKKLYHQVLEELHES
ncbi:MAG: tRNA (guanosine(37)-N1)-methyltransferase TrmD [Firmicutes bacterium]|nr:tRNA (guanosine(37)-N1)-methyltransferase TrmD [Bacillota bacterium]